MTYKTILIHCNSTNRMGALLAPTLTLASAFRSHIVGLSVVPPVTVVATGAIEAPPLIVDAHCDLYRQEVPAMRRQFEEAMIGRPVTSEWRDLDADAFGVLDVVLEHGRSADLIVASQTDDDWPASQWLDVADHVAVESGRPVLIIPNDHASALVGGRVLVAWNGRREAARAAFDALPILKQATAVKVVTIAETDEPSQQPGADVCTALARHGVKAGKTEHIVASTGAGPALAAEANGFGADLVVDGVLWALAPEGVCLWRRNTPLPAQDARAGVHVALNDSETRNRDPQPWTTSSFVSTLWKNWSTSRA